MCAQTLLSRRSLAKASAAAVLVGARGRAAAPSLSGFASVATMPDSAAAHAETDSFKLSREGSRFTSRDVELTVTPSPDGSTIVLRAPRTEVSRVHLRWAFPVPAGLQYLGDAWERSYGDLAWRGLEPERVMPWYFLATDGTATAACGVEVAPKALCFWQVDPAGVSLWLDVRNGGRGVALGGRDLPVAKIKAFAYPDKTPFAAAIDFCRKLCAQPRLPALPVYGGNNWYYAYGKSSASNIRDDSARIASFASSTANKPFMVIDDGWQPNPTAGPWNKGNGDFPDMAQLASDMQRIGVQPGLWMRPLFTRETVPETWRMNSPSAHKDLAQGGGIALDPTVPDVMEKLQSDMRTACGWGYRMIKHDFSTYDLLGRWGHWMNADVTDNDWNFSDRTKTNAEVIRSFYEALRSAAGDTLLLGCNTVGHLSAGLFEMQRTGDDTSGRDWNRTRRMGVNTLAFRAPQHNTFFAIDADCVGLTKQVPWHENRQWLDLLARSGTALFVSPAPDAVGPEQRSALKAAFAIAAKPQPTGEPLDWLRNSEPEAWKLDGARRTYDWFGKDGGSPFLE